MAQQKELQIKYRLQKIKIINFNFNIQDDKNVNFDQLYIETILKQNIDIDKEFIIITLGIHVFTDESHKDLLCTLTVEFSFHTIGIKDVKKNGDQLKIPNDFILSLVSISYSTCRGIFFEKCASTCLSNLILPLINPRDLLPKEEN